ncbi:hypothetical protein KPH14_006162 [Odynerus spinipes]|uniref:Uncharacterized protein n=1 Tax=Odynerus spinipes TaxID=1348599 RepID=A0AAD9VMM8_9HYME|nr:hypothetical protein KPH14_006162 [Odynerus spinipes]
MQGGLKRSQSVLERQARAAGWVGGGRGCVEREEEKEEGSFRRARNSPSADSAKLWKASETVPPVLRSRDLREPIVVLELEWRQSSGPIERQFYSKSDITYVTHRIWRRSCERSTMATET